MQDEIREISYDQWEQIIKDINLYVTILRDKISNDDLLKKQIVSQTEYLKIWNMFLDHENGLLRLRKEKKTQKFMAAYLAGFIDDKPIYMFFDFEIFRKVLNYTIFKFKPEKNNNFMILLNCNMKLDKKRAVWINDEGYIPPLTAEQKKKKIIEAYIDAQCQIRLQNHERILNSLDEVDYAEIAELIAGKLKQKKVKAEEVKELIATLAIRVISLESLSEYSDDESIEYSESEVPQLAYASSELENAGTDSETIFPLLDSFQAVFTKVTPMQRDIVTRYLSFYMLDLSYPSGSSNADNEKRSFFPKFFIEKEHYLKVQEVLHQNTCSEEKEQVNAIKYSIDAENEDFPNNYPRLLNLDELDMVCQYHLLYKTYTGAIIFSSGRFPENKEIAERHQKSQATVTHNDKLIKSAFKNAMQRHYIDRQN